MNLASKYGNKTYSTKKPKRGTRIERPTLTTTEIRYIKVVIADDHQLPDTGSTSEASDYQLSDPIECPLITDFDNDIETSPQPRKVLRWILPRKRTTNEDVEHTQVLPEIRPPTPNIPQEPQQRIRRVFKRTNSRIDPLAIDGVQYLKRIASVCRKCKASFDDESRLVKHIKAEHSKYKDPLPPIPRVKSTPVYKPRRTCPTCYSTFPSIDHMARHALDVHNKETIDPETNLPFVLPPPGSKRQKSSLCELCGKTIPSKGRFGLKVHILRAHTPPENRPYPCDFDGCSNSYIRPGELIHHRRGHKELNYSLYECPHCGSQFLRKENLKTHLETFHKKLYPVYRCKQCGRGSESKEAREDHMKKYHNRKDRYCPHCDFVTSKNGNLRCHIKNMHKDTLNEFGKVSKEDEAKIAEMAAKSRFAADNSSETETGSDSQIDDEPMANPMVQQLAQHNKVLIKTPTHFFLVQKK